MGVDGASYPAGAPLYMFQPQCAPSWPQSPPPAGGRLTLVRAALASGSPQRVLGESANGGWVGVVTRSGIGVAALCAGGPTRLPGLS